MIIVNVSDFHNARRTYIDALERDVDGILFVGNGSNWRKSFYILIPPAYMRLLDGGNNEDLKLRSLGLMSNLKDQVSEKYRKIKAGGKREINVQTCEQVN